jgi:hypothetical protein
MAAVAADAAAGVAPVVTDAEAAGDAAPVEAEAAVATPSGSATAAATQAVKRRLRKEVDRACDIVVSCAFGRASVGAGQPRS